MSFIIYSLLHVSKTGVTQKVMLFDISTNTTSEVVEGTGSCHLLFSFSCLEQGHSNSIMSLIIPSLF